MKKIVLSLVLLPTSLLCSEGVLSQTISAATMAPGMEEHATLTGHLDPLTQQLHAAAKEGNENAINELLAQGAQVNGCDSWGSTALHWAVNNNHETCVKRLVITGMALLDVQDNIRGSSPLHYAVELDLVPIVSFLLEQGANQHIQDNNGMTVFQRAFNSPWGLGNSLTILHSHGARLDNLPDIVQKPLPICSLANGIGTLRHLLAPSCRNSQFASQEQKDLALALAIRWRRTECTALLLEHGANPEVLVHDKISLFLLKSHIVPQLILHPKPVTKPEILVRALPYAIMHNDEETVNLLLRAGANKEKHHESDTPRGRLRPLLIAAVKSPSLLRLLIDAGAQVDGRSTFGHTALHTAALYEKVGALRLLLASNASCDLQDVFGRTALYLALSQQGNPCVQLLQDHGATLEFLEADPLYQACKSGDKDELLKAVRRLCISLLKPTAEDKEEIKSMAKRINEVEAGFMGNIVMLNELNDGALHLLNKSANRLSLVRYLLIQLTTFFRVLHAVEFAFPESIADLCNPKSVRENFSKIIAAGIDERVAEIQRKDTPLVTGAQSSSQADTEEQIPTEASEAKRRITDAEGIPHE